MKIPTIVTALLFSYTLCFSTAGPDVIVLSSSTMGNNGEYVKNGMLLDCDCWENSTLNRKIIRDDNDTWFVFEALCAPEGSPIEPIGMSTSCDPTVLPGVDAADVIPTLSQWGLIILGLCLSVFGTVAVKQRRQVLG